jgi:hypothetical protein
MWNIPTPLLKLFVGIATQTFGGSWSYQRLGGRVFCSFFEIVNRNATEAIGNTL